MKRHLAKENERPIPPLIARPEVPRGGVPAGAVYDAIGRRTTQEILPRIGRLLAAAGLAPGALDVLVVRKLGVPGPEEMAMGALASGGVRVLNEEVVRHLGITQAMLDQAAGRAQPELERRHGMRDVKHEGRAAEDRRVDLCGMEQRDDQHGAQVVDDGERGQGEKTEEVQHPLPPCLAFFGFGHHDIGRIPKSPAKSKAWLGSLLIYSLDKQEVSRIS